jgi:hypothetical protein
MTMSVATQAERSAAVETLTRDGWMTFDASFLDLPGIRARLDTAIREQFRGGGVLDGIDGIAALQDQRTYYDLCQFLMTTLTEMRLTRRLVDSQADIIAAVLSNAVLLQGQPMVRVKRPRKDDVVPPHRDIFYGESFFDLNIWTPLVFPSDEVPVFKIIPGSNLLGYGDVPFHPEPDPDADMMIRGSGRPYLHKIIEPEFLAAHRFAEIPVPLGHALLFFPATVHAGPPTTGSGMVLTFDFRIRHCYLPERFSHNKKGFYSEVVFFTDLARKLHELSEDLVVRF